MPLEAKTISNWRQRAAKDVDAGAHGEDWPADVVLALTREVQRLDAKLRERDDFIELAHREVTNLSPTIRLELATELARALERRLNDLDTFHGSCACRHAEARAFLAKLKRIAGLTPASARR